MSHLSPDLYEQIVHLCEPHFRLPDERDAHLTSPLRDWEGYYRIDWSGSPRSFTVHLVELLPPDRLQAVLRALLVGYQDEPTITRLCQQIDADQGLLSAPSDAPFVRYHQERVETWSQPRYRYDSRFVQLTLLLDKGPDTPDMRFVPDSQHHRYNSLPALLDAVEDKTFVLLGSPGSGKTTLLRRLQWERAWEELKATTGKTSMLASLSAYTAATPGQPPPDPQRWLESQWQQMQQQHPSLPAFEPMLQKGRLLLLLDGLNEMPHQDKADYRARIEQWRQFLHQTRLYGNTIIFSCRSLDYSAPLSSETAPVRQVRVEPLTPTQIETFLQVYLAEKSERVWVALRQDNQRLELFANPFFLRLLVAEVAATGNIPTGQAALLTGFVRRALSREINEHHHRLFQPGLLLSDEDYEQVLHGDWQSPHDLPAEGSLIPYLEQLAYAMQDGRQSRESGQVRIAERTAVSLINHPQAREIITAGIQLNVLDKDLARRELLFFHQLIQEYFAARVLAHTPQPERAAVPWRAGEMQPALAAELARLDVSDPLPPPPATGWEETTLMAAAMSDDQEAFVAALAPLNLVLTARCAATPDVKVSAALRHTIQQSLAQRLADVDADLRARIAAAEALAELGDPRFERRTGPYGDYLLPPLAPVAGGVYRIGSEERKGLARLWQSLRRRPTGYEGYKDEKPAHQVEITPFQMGVFPVTSAEYALFMVAGGYEDERWWQTEAARAWRHGESGNKGQRASYRDLVSLLQNKTEDEIRAWRNHTPDEIEELLELKHADTEEWENQVDEWYPPGKVYTQPKSWEDGRFNHSSHPVVGVTWFEARAYCAWLSAQTGELVDLPKEVEWEAAARGRKVRDRGARGKDGRLYAYGNTFDATRCNTFETHIRRTTPVGIFPDGRTPEGIYDLSGNVWEWTSTIWGKELNRPDFAYPYNAGDGREDQTDGTSRRVVRGGSWNLDLSYAHAAYRLNFHPTERLNDYGFRVVVRRPPAHS